MSVFRDLLLTAATVGVSMLLPGAAPFAWASFASRTALVLGVQTFARSQQRKAERRAAVGRGPTDNTVTLRSDDYPECIAYGLVRLPTILAYRCTHGDKKQFMTMVLIAPLRHELTAIDDILLDGVSIGALDPSGRVQSGSRWFTDDITMQFVQQAGGAIGTTVTLAHTAAQLVSVDSVAVASREILTSGTGEGTAEWRDNSRDRVLESAEYSVDGNVVTLLADSAGLEVTVTYRARTGGKAWLRVRKNLGLAAGGTYDVDGPLAGGGTTLSAASNSEWRASDKLCAIPNLVLTIEYDPSGRVWAAGVPQAVTMIARGAKLYDPTKDSTNGGTGAHRLADPSTWEYSTSAPLAWRDYMRRELSCTANELDDASVRAAVPIAATPVNLLAGSTEEAFAVNGIVSTGDTWAANIEKLAMSMIGNAFLVGARWSIEPYGWTAPVMSFPESATADGEIELEARPGLDEVINCVRGRCLDMRASAESPLGVLTMGDFPPREIAAYVTEDQGTKWWHDVELPLTLGFERGQRMATFYAHRARQSLIAKIPFSNEVYDGVVPGKRIRLPWDVFGWNFAQDGGTGKVVQVIERITEPPDKVILSVKEDAAAIYSWDYTAATAIDPTPNTALPPPNYVAPVAVQAVVSDETTFIRRADGALIGYVAFRFALPAQDDVVVRLHWKRATEGAWREVQGQVGDTELRAEGVVGGEVLNAYLVAFNGLRAPSAPTWIPTYTVGASVASPLLITVENELKGATFEYGAGDCRAVAVGVPGGVVGVGKHPSAGYSVPGPVSSGWLYASTTASGSAQFAAMVWPRVPAVGGETYALYAGLIGWECDAQMAVDWFDALGNFIRADGTEYVPQVAAESASVRPDNPEHYTFARRMIAAPSNARFAEVSARAVGAWSTHPQKNVWVHKPFFARVPAGLTLFPPWNAGPVSMVGTSFIAPNSTWALYEDRKPPAEIGWPALGQSWNPGLASVWVPIDADIEHGAILRVHVNATIAFTGRATAGSYASLTAVLGLYDQPVDAAGQGIEVPTNGVVPLDDGVSRPTYGGSLSVAGLIFDQHFAAATSLVDRTLIGSVNASLTFRWVKGAGRRFGMTANFDPRVFPFPLQSAWQVSAAAPSVMSVEILKR